MKKKQRALRVPDHVADLIRSLHPDLKRKIKSGLQRILDDADSGKALKDELSDLRSFRVGKFRIIYRNASNEFTEIVAVGPRKNIYEETLRFVRAKKK